MAPATTATTIVSLEAWACSIPLPQPLSFRTFEVRSREYVALRLTTAGGLTSDTVALSRRSPIDVALTDVVGPIVMGRDGCALDDRLADIEGATRALDQEGVIGRARSLLETCLWDLRAQAQEQPLWELLGGGERELPVLLVEGYALPGESHRGFSERLARRVVDEGYSALKIEAASYDDPRDLAERLRLFRQLAGDGVQVVVDMAWSWRDLDEARAAAEHWAPYGLTWIEDPFTRSRTRDIAALRGVAGSPIAAGDEATRPGELTALLDCGAVDVLRLDATAIGGIGALGALAEQAARARAGVSAHVHPELHQHCALARPAFEHVEAFPLDRPFDCAHHLLQRALMDDVHEGCVSPPRTPGTGLRLDLDAVRRTAYRHAALDSRRTEDP